MNNLKTRHIHILLNALFFLGMLVFWRFFYVSHLLYKEQMQLFLLRPEYLIKHLQFQGGLAIYLGEFTVQFFQSPWLASILMSVWLLLLAIGIQKILGEIYGNKVFVPAFLPPILYCVLLCNSFYEFSGLVATVASVWMVFLFLKHTKANIQAFMAYVYTIVCYWLFGGAFILFAGAIVAIKIISTATSFRKKILLLFGYTIFSLALPYFSYLFLLTDHLKSAWFSRAFYQLSSIVPLSLIVLFVLPALLVVLHNWMIKISSARGILLVNLALGVVLVLGLIGGLISQPNYNEERELRYSILVEQKDWDGILKEAEKDPGIKKEGKLALSLALAQKGEMSTRLFEFDPRLGELFIPFNWQGQMPIIANEPYFYLGLNNFSKMLCNESIESTPNEKMPARAVKRLVENYIIDGQYKIAERYLWQLENTLFYRKWAMDTRAYLFNDSKVKEHPIWGRLRQLKTKDDFYFQYDRNDVALLTLLRSNQQNKPAYEYLMSWYLLQKDFDAFLKYLPLSNNMNYEKFPLVFQEALAYVFTLLEEVPEDLKQFSISADVQQNLNKYAQAFQNGGSNKPAEMKKQFGQTYWYYVHFTETENE